MSVKGTCPGCGTAYKLPDSKFGKKAHCPECAYEFVVGQTSWLEGRGLYLLIGVVVLVLLFCGGLSTYFLFSRPNSAAIDKSPLARTYFNKIRGGMSEEEVEAILGKPNIADLPPSPTDAALVGEKGRLQEWKNGQKEISILYCDHKVVRWNWTDGTNKDEKTDPNYTLTAQSHK